MAAVAGNVPQLQAIITSHTVCTFKMMHCVLHAVATTSILDSFDDCWYAKHCTISVFSI